jgi:broad specificity phosphatase PhoE
VQAFLDEIEPLLERSDVLAFTHEGALQALLANLRNAPTSKMMITIPNGAIYMFNRHVGADGSIVWNEDTKLPDPLLPIGAPSIDPPPATPPAKGR